MVGQTGFEPATFRPPDENATPALLPDGQHTTGLGPICLYYLNLVGS